MTCRPAFVLALDGENLELLEAFTGEFGLPVLRDMLERGRRGLLDPWINPLTPPSWTSFLTGTWFPRHGIHGFIRHDPATRREEVARYRHIRGATMLELADGQGARVLCLNLPMTWPPPELRLGSVVSGFDVPGADVPFAWPASLEARIRERVPGFEAMVLSMKGSPSDAAARRAHLAGLVERVRQRRAVLEAMLGEGRPDLAVVQIQETDIVHHKAWPLVVGGPSGDPDRGLLRDLYREVDGIAGRLRDAMGPGALGLVLSDHGGCAGRYVLQVNTLLCSWGLARALAGADGSLARPDEVGRGLRARVLRKVRGALGRPAAEEEGTIDAAAFVNRELQLDWPATRVYLSTGDHLGLLHPGDGPPLSPAETEALARRLLEYRLPDGTPALEQALPGSAVFPAEGGSPGPAPLLVLVPADGVFLGRRTGGAVVHPYPPEIGSHRRMGMACWTGEGVAAGEDPEPLPMVDVLPTLFAGMGLGVPEGLDGGVRDRVFLEPPLRRAGTAGGGPPRAGADASRGEEEELLRRLEDLGYMG